MIIYITGYGRSGSTALSEELEKKLNACNLGEVKFLYRDEKDDLLDPYWLNFKKEHEDQLADNRLKRFDNFFGWIKWRNKRWYKQRWQKIFNAMGLDIEGDIIIDSSKTTFDSLMRGVYLYHSFTEVCFLQPQRNTSEIIKSLMKGRNSDIERGRKKGKVERMIHLLFIGIPQLIITKLFTQIYQFYGLETIDIENMEEEVEEFIKRKKIKKTDRSLSLPMIYGNRSRKKN